MYKQEILYTLSHAQNAQKTNKGDNMKYNPKTIGIWIQALEFVVIAGIGAFIIAATIKFINLYW